MGLRSSTVEGQRNVAAVIDHALGCGCCRSSTISINDLGNSTVIGIIGVSDRFGDSATAVLGDDTGQTVVVVPRSSKNLALISQFVEIPDDVVFTVEYSVRAAQMAVYEFLNIDRKIPLVTPHDRSLRVELEALIKAFK